MNGRRIIAGAAVLAILAESAALIALGAFLGDPGPAGRDPEPPAVRLIGLDCKGASGPLFAREESDFPQCRAIRPIEHKESE